MTPDVQWFLDRLQAEMPTRIHSREVDDGGSPQWATAFASWLSDNGQMTTISVETDFCHHPTLGGKPGHCPTCDDSGLRERHRHTLRRPMKAALRRVSSIPVPAGRPKLHSVLLVLGANGGDFGFTARALAADYAYMARPMQANYWIAIALAAVRSRYREDVPAREIRDKSESQSIAEAAA
jgi:hypothetical protein